MYIYCESVYIFKHDCVTVTQGIVRDLERQQMKKIENLKKLTDQKELEAAYRRQAMADDKVDR